MPIFVFSFHEHFLFPLFLNVIDACIKVNVNYLSESTIERDIYLRCSWLNVINLLYNEIELIKITK